MSEAEVLLAIHARATPAADALFRFSHELATLPACAALVLSAALWHRLRGERGAALAWLLVGLSTFLLQEGLKQLVARPRPELWPRLVPTASPAFPSGHALAAATFYPLLAATLGRSSPRLAPLFHALAVALALFVGFGRLYLGVHWPSDVLAGWALGGLQATVALRFLRPRTAALSARASPAG